MVAGMLEHRDSFYGVSDVGSAALICLARGAGFGNIKGIFCFMRSAILIVL
jgi:hypothetical protein